MYIITSPTSAPTQVTFNGKENAIFNGIPDWVYEGGCKIKPLSPLTPSINHPAIQRSESLTIITLSSYRGDVLIRSGFLVVTRGEVPGLHWVQWHPGPHHRVQLVWGWAVPQHCLHPLSKGGTSRHSLCNSNLPVCRWLLLFYAHELSSLCLILTISFSVCAARYSQPWGKSVCCGYWEHYSYHSG